jgi:hypothetical protein
MAQASSAGKMPKVPNASEEQQKMMADMMAKMLANLKTTFNSKKTGRTDTIQGIQADEREITLTIEMPIPMGGPDAVIHMKMVSQMWSARPEEALKNQAIRELAGYNLYAHYIMNPANMMQRFTSGMPGATDAFKSMTEELSKTKGLLLRSHVSMYMPLPPSAVKQMAQQNPGAGPINPDAPMFEMTQEAVELSSAPVDAALFQIPADYKVSAADDMVKGLFQSQMAAFTGGGAK